MKKINENFLKVLKENSIKLNETSFKLNENIDINLANTNDLIGKICEEKFQKSLLYQICDVIPMKHPTGNLAYIWYDDKQNRIEVQNKIVNAVVDKIISSEITTETIENLKNLYDINAIDFLKDSFIQLSNNNENARLLKLLNAESTDADPVTLTDPNNDEIICYNILQRASECIALSNTIYTRGFNGFLLVPRKVAGAFIGMSFKFKQDLPEDDITICDTGRFKVYIVPDIDLDGDTGEDTCYVGIKTNTLGQSALQLTPYALTFSEATDYESGHKSLFLNNRYGLTVSAFHNAEPDNIENTTKLKDTKRSYDRKRGMSSKVSMLYKFKVKF